MCNFSFLQRLIYEVFVDWSGGCSFLVDHQSWTERSVNNVCTGGGGDDDMSR